MKTLIQTFILGFSLCLLMYILIAFMHVEANPLQWITGARVFYSIYILVVIFFASPLLGNVKSANNL